MKTPIADLKWVRPESGMWVGTVRLEMGIEYQAMLRYRVLDEVWEVLCTVDGTLIHRSEHESRGEAAAEAIVALARAIDIRERTEP